MDPLKTSKNEADVKYENEVVQIHIDLLRSLVGIVLLASFLPKAAIGMCMLGISVLFRQPLRSHDSQSVLMLPEFAYSAVRFEVIPFFLTYAADFAATALAIVLLFSSFGKKLFPMFWARRSLRSHS